MPPLDLFSWERIYLWSINRYIRRVRNYTPKNNVNPSLYISMKVLCNLHKLAITCIFISIVKYLNIHYESFIIKIYSIQSHNTYFILGMQLYKVHTQTYKSSILANVMPVLFFTLYRHRHRHWQRQILLLLLLL